MDRPRSPKSEYESSSLFTISYLILGEIEMPIAKLEITSCDKCPNSKSDRHYTADSFEFEFDWKCSLMEGKIISEYADMGDSVTIPNWCPIADPMTIKEPESPYEKYKEPLIIILKEALRISFSEDPIKASLLDENDVEEGVKMMIDQLGGWKKIFIDLEIGERNGLSADLQVKAIKSWLPILFQLKK